MAYTERLVGSGVTIHGSVTIVFLLLVLFYASCSEAAEDVGAEDGSLAIRFVPIQAKAKQLVAVELVRPAHPGEQYKILERVVFKNDWRPALFTMSDQYNPGKCIVKLIQNGYDLDCTLNRESGKPYDRRTRVKSVEEVIDFINEFSKQRAVPIPPSPREGRPARIRLA